MLRKSFSSLALDKDKDTFINLFFSFYGSFDIENSTNSINECVKIMENDYFLCKYTEEFKKKSKEILLESYVLLNNSIDVGYVNFF